MAITYTIEADPTAGGNDANNADFDIENPDVLELSSNAPLAGGSYKVTVKAVDGVSGEFGYGFFTVVINPRITALTLNQTNVPIVGDSAGTLVGDFEVSGGTAPFTFALVAGTGDGDNGNYQVNVADIEVKSAAVLTDPTDAIRVEVTDAAGDTFEQALTVNVQPVTGTLTVILTLGSPLFDDDVAATDVGTVSAS
jgi:Tol biopolymer transport system component